MICNGLNVVVILLSSFSLLVCLVNPMQQTGIILVFYGIGYNVLEFRNELYVNILKCKPSLITV